MLLTLHKATYDTLVTASCIRQLVNRNIVYVRVQKRAQYYRHSVSREVCRKTENKTWIMPEKGAIISVISSEDTMLLTDA